MAVVKDELKLKVSVYIAKGVGLWDEGKNAIRTPLYQHPEKSKIALFRL